MVGPWLALKVGVHLQNRASDKRHKRQEAFIAATEELDLSCCGGRSFGPEVCEAPGFIRDKHSVGVKPVVFYCHPLRSHNSKTI